MSSLKAIFIVIVVLVGLTLAVPISDPVGEQKTPEKESDLEGSEFFWGGWGGPWGGWGGPWGGWGGPWGGWGGPYGGWGGFWG